MNEINQKIINVLFKLQRSFGRRINYIPELTDLTLIQLQALFNLKQNANCTVSEVALYFKTSVPTATILLDRLEQMNLIQRVGDKKDKRVTRLHLSKNGEKLLEKVKKYRNNKINEVLKKLTESDKKNLLRIIEKLTV